MIYAIEAVIQLFKKFRKNGIAAALLSYAYLKCNVIIINNIYFGNKFLCNFIPWKAKSKLSPKFWKTLLTTAVSIKLFPIIFILMSSFKGSTLHAKFCTIPGNRI